MKETDFIWGAQYYRAPTPAAEHWDADLRQMKELGFTDIKYWVQWRWTHRDENAFYFADLDRLMNLAAEVGLRVTLNIICDVTPSWLLEKHPDAVQIRADGANVQPYASACRQIGGMPGPCYNHPAARAARERFLSETVKRFAPHPALFMWDVWNEPEQCHKYRKPDEKTLVCYCPHCRAAFSAWLHKKYGTIERLNDIWGRCYRDWEDVELPQNGEVFGDMIDFRTFGLDTMTEEARMRLDIVRKHDAHHSAYLHVVPETGRIFNALTGVDDFALAKQCDVFASTNFANPIWSVLTRSAAGNKITYNAECHIGTGSTKMHPRIVTLADMVRDFVPQLGIGLRGFLFWQYHAEVLGIEAPAWGVAKPNGAVGSIGLAAKTFMKKLGPYIGRMDRIPRRSAEIAIWKECTNEIHAWCMNGTPDTFADGVEGYLNTLYLHDYRCEIVDDKRVEEGLDGVRLLILPEPYAMSDAFADAVDRFVRNGGTVLSEAHAGGYECDRNRHANTMPGCGLAKRWGITEVETTSAYYVESGLAQEMNLSAVNDDVKKAVAAYGVKGGKYIVIETEKGPLLGAERYAELSAPDGAVLGCVRGKPLIVRKCIGSGAVIYCGSNIGMAGKENPEAFGAFLEAVCSEAGVRKSGWNLPTGLHCEQVGDGLWSVDNRTASGISFSAPMHAVPLFGIAQKEREVMYLPANSADLLIKKEQRRDGTKK